METFNSHLQGIGTLISDLLSSIILHGLGGGIIGFIIGIILVLKFRKNGFFNRSNALWSFIAKCNYVLLPLALSIIGLTQGGIYGAHDTAEVWIEQTTTPIIDYAENYLPQIQSFCNQHILRDEGQSATLEELVIAQNPNAASGMKGSIMTSFNVFLLGTFLDMTTPVSGDLGEPLLILSQVDIKNLDRNVFELLPSTMRAATSFYFAGIYWFFFAPFGMYLFIMISEVALFRFFFKASQSIITFQEYSHSDDLSFV